MNGELFDAGLSTLKGRYNRRQFMRVSALTAGSALLVACGGTNENLMASTTPLPKEGVAPSAVTATAQASVGKTYFPSPAPNVPDAFTAPLPPYQSVTAVPGMGGTVNVFSISYVAPETPHAQNKFWQGLEKRLNVKWNLNHAVGGDNYQEKASAILASGKFPDLFLLLPDLSYALYKAIDQGAFNDLTPYLSGAALKEYPNLARYPDLLWKNAAINGKLYAVPRPFTFASGMMLYRKDWAKKLGIAEPKSADDFYKMMTTFSKSNPEGKQVWGMGFAADGIFKSSSQFILNMFRVPSEWRREANGSMTYFIQTDEYRQAVDFMRRMYAAGLFYPDSLTSTGLQMRQAFLAGKIGSYVDGSTALDAVRFKFQSVNPKADVGILIPPGADGGKGSYWMGKGYNGMTAIPSSISDSNRIKELLRILNYLAAPAFSVEANYISLGVDDWDNKPDANGIRALTQTGSKEIGALANVAFGNRVFYYPSDLQLGPIFQDYTRRLFEIGVANPTDRVVPPPTAQKKSDTLENLVNDRVLRIVKGVDPLSALDTAIQEWKSQGGEQMAQEYAQALAKLP
ncbi:extracellular solute-binding protein [Ktedonosporobacter rubrisoli]|uniref:Extracellular solute-binding protein n=1 Tax=Ktedonosporobacter rubrisoli TaxID=2509675 RepID=A0A4P6JVF7_KTERU|nr:extracellular solute-binding protein [Ktedonosporobacter rubrisoli]QBD79353.1 extracellular solute-binding protein [Ktedonosporobacter rubrisoli]